MKGGIGGGKAAGCSVEAVQLVGFSIFALPFLFPLLPTGRREEGKTQFIHMNHNP